MNSPTILHNRVGIIAFCVALIAISAEVASAQHGHEHPEHETEQVVNLTAGWNLVSLHVQAGNDRIDHILAPVSDKVVIVRDRAGNTYSPSLGIDTIHRWDAGTAYHVFLREDAELRVRGRCLDGQGYNVTLVEGWNVVPVISMKPVSVEKLFNDLSDLVVLVRDGNGNTYWPEHGVRSLEYLEPGRGYHVFARGTSTVTFDDVADRDSWDYVVANVEIEGDLFVPDGERWLIGPNVRIAGNLWTTSGTIAMRPGSSLTFVGADPDEYVGGGMTYGPEFKRDIGLWIGHGGVLDIRGTPKTGWNRTGMDSTWKEDDEYWIAPTNVGDYRPRRWYPGDPIPQIHPDVPPAEVMNITRDIVIQGPGHIHVHSQRPQRIEYVELRNMGLSSEAHDGVVLGRYALHLHHGGDGTRGTIIRGVSAIDSGGRVFVPHESNGISFVDNVSVNSRAEGFWWDTGDETNDLFVDRLKVSGVYMPRSVSGSASRVDGIALGHGDNMSISNSAVSGVQGSKLSVGFSWTTRQAHRRPSVWTFEEGNVAHNNRGPGLRFWVNDAFPHHVQNYTSYRNGEGGIENGAYTNGVRYTNVHMVDEYLFHNSSARTTSGGEPAAYRNLRISSTDGPAIRIGRMNIEPHVRLEFQDCVLEVPEGAPKVVIGRSNSKNRFYARFTNCNLHPDDFRAPSSIPVEMEGTNILVENANGSRWEITVDVSENRLVTTRLDN